MTLDDLLKRLEQILEQGRNVIETGQYSHELEDEWVDTGMMMGFRSAALSFIERVYGQTHTHYKEFDSSVDKRCTSYVEIGISILRSIHDEISGGWLFSVRGLVTAEVFTDFLEMAEYLLSEDYKDPAAVLAGSVLEEQLRQLCKKNKIDIEIISEGRSKPKKADRLNADLGKAEIYNKLDQKTVTAWFDLRNKAAHGHYDQYTKEQVVNMIQGITEFLTRNAIQ